ncbi:hypothetical protein [Streptomyces sp. A5-4]|uniref:hypothetical protein n=1 Tax=Streptomyces sp. A5-4 TaxID=3384771 RepID=UPI003DA859A2
MTASMAFAVLAGAGWGGYTLWHDGSPGPQTHALCAPDFSRAAYVATESAYLSLVTVTGEGDFLEEEADEPGGVQTVHVRVDKNLKGAPGRTLELGQSVGLDRAGAYTTTGATHTYHLLRPGKQYVISYYLGGSYGDGYVLYSKAEPRADRAVRQWSRHIAARAAAPSQAGC